VSRGKIIIVMILISVVVMVMYLRRDLALPHTALLRKLPDIVVEHLDFARTIKSRDWRVSATDAESDSGMIRARSLDIKVTDRETKRIAHISAGRGEFSRESSNIWLWGVLGRVFLGERRVDFSASRADYNSSSDAWFFADGLSASDDKISVTGGVASINSSGVLSIGKGARARWTIE
jgi:hypothetical protein